MPSDAVLRRVVHDRAPGARALVLVLALGIVVGMAVLIAVSAADQLRRTAAESALHEIEAIVRGYVDPTLGPTSLVPGRPADPAIQAQIERLATSSTPRIVHVWAPDGTIVYSSLPEARGRRVDVGPDLRAALSGEGFSHYDARGDPDQVTFGAGIHEHLEVMLPIRLAAGAAPVGVYQVLQDAAPIDARVSATERDVFVIALAAALAMLLLVWLAFGGISRVLTRQNQRLQEHAAAQELLTADLRRSEERFRSLVRNASDVILVLSPEGVITYESPAVKTVMGYEPGSRLGTNAVAQLHPEDRPRVQRLLREMSEVPGAELTIELRGLHADGSWRVLEGTAKNLLDDPAVSGFVVNYYDVTERRQMEDQLRHNAFHDVLTGLANRALLTDRLEHALGGARRHDRGLAVLFIDLDDFKATNDSMGHTAGDQLLAAAAERVVACLRAGDTAARVGGDEFAVLLEDVTSATTSEVAGRILEALRRPFRIGGHQLHAHASIGVAFRTDVAQTADELLRDADVAMYVAKRHGKDRIEVFHKDAHGPTVAGLALLADLPRAFDLDQLSLVFQPVIDLDGDRIVGVEALVRWHHPERGLVLPDEFVPLAEDSGLIGQIGLLALREACRQVRAWDRVVLGPPLSIGVNVSGRQVEPGLVEAVRDALRSARLSPRRLILEITESTILADPDTARATLERLREMGVRIAIDDFGTGRASLDYLRRLPVDQLKVDRSYVAALGDSEQGTELLGSILALGKALHLEVVAEGVEDEGQLQALRSLGAKFAQGFYFSRPLPPPEMTGFLREAFGRRPSRRAAVVGAGADVPA